MRARIVNVGALLQEDGIILFKLNQRANDYRREKQEV